MSRKEILIPQEFSRLLDDDWREAAVFGGRYSLKSHTVARVLLIKALERQTRIGCFRELQTSISDSSHQLLSDLINYYNLNMFTVGRDAILNNLNGSNFVFKGLRNNAQAIKSLEGLDYAWVEEAQTITEPNIEVLTPTIRKPKSKLIYTYNRLFELDPIHKRLVVEGRPNTLIINVNFDVAEKYGWLPDVIREEIERDRVENPYLYNHKWLGQPISQTDNAIIDRNSILTAMQRTVDDDGAIEIGADIARMGSDRTVFKKRKGLRMIDSKIYSKLRTTDVCDQLEVFADFDKSILIKIDDTGVGGGVTDEMMKRGYNIMPINFGSKASDPDKYPNLISEAWFYLSSIMDTIQLQMNTDLLMELSTRQWVMDSKGRRGVESKDSYKKRGYRSPDEADATILCYYTKKVEDFCFDFL